MTNRVRVCCSLVAALALSAGSVRAEGGSGSDPAPFAPARQAVADLDWKAAIQLYGPLQSAAAPGSSAWTEATFMLATAYAQVQPPDASTIGRADGLFEQVVQQSKDDRYTARALMARGRILEMQDFGADKIDLDGARKFYEQVLALYPNQPIAAEAVLRAGATLVMAFDGPGFVKVRQGIDFMENWVRAHPSDPLATVIWQYLGDSYFKPLGDYKNALRCYEEVDRLGWIDAGNQGVWYWRIARMAEQQLNDRESAVKYYTKIVKETPNSGKGYESLQALRRLNAPLPPAPLLEDPAARVAAQAAMPSTKPSTRPSTQEARP